MQRTNGIRLFLEADLAMCRCDLAERSLLLCLLLVGDRPAGSRGPPRPEVPYKNMKYAKPFGVNGTDDTFNTTSAFLCVFALHASIPLTRLFRVMFD